MPLGPKEQEEAKLIQRGPRSPISTGPEDFSMQGGYPKLWLRNEIQLYDGDVVEVDPGAEQSLNCDSRINNADPGFNFLWSIGTTIWDVTHNRAVGFKVDNADGATGQANPTIDVGRITEPTQFRVKVWANQAFQAPPPPQSAW